MFVSRFTKSQLNEISLTVLFNNLTAFFGRNTLFRVIKARHTMFLSFILGRFLLLNTFSTKIVRWIVGKGFIKRLHVHSIIFISQHFDWVLCIISECVWMNYF